MQLLHRGVVFHNAETKFSDGGSKAKFLVVVSVSADPALFVVATSQTDFFDRNPDIAAIVDIPANTLKTFPKRTILDCRGLQRLSKGS